MSKLTINKSILKDIVHQMIGVTLQGFDCSIDDSAMTEKDKENCYWSVPSGNEKIKNERIYFSKNKKKDQN